MALVTQYERSPKLKKIIYFILLIKFLPSTDHNCFIYI